VSESAVNRRAWPRIPAASLTDVRVSLVAGPDVELVNLSRGGALLEVGARYAMRAFVRLKLTRTTGETTVVPATVSWSRVGTLARGRINYLVAVVFEQPIADFAAVTGYRLDEGEAAQLPADTSATVTPPPVLETSSPPESVAASPAAALVDDESRLQLAAAEARAENLRHELDAATTDLTNLTLTNEALVAQLEAAGVELKALREQAAAARRHVAEEQARVTEETADAAARTAALQETLDRHHAEHTTALDEQRARLEAEIEALARNVSVQQEDNAQLISERAALLDRLAEAAANADAVRAAAETREQEHARAIHEQQGLDAQVRQLTEVIERQQAEYALILAEREKWESERFTLLEQLADALTKADAVQTRLEAREQEHVQAMAAEQARYETLIAELIQASNDQHTEYQHVLAEQTASREEERARADRNQAALFCERAAAERERAGFESRTRELEARLEALEALCAAHETRYRTLRRDAEKLVAVLDAPVTAAAPDQEELASFPVHAKTEQAVA
jgi:hypothetical protein